MEISSLSRLCLGSAADNMAMWCRSTSNEDFFKYMYTIGPFNDLSTAMMQELLDISFHKQTLKASYFPILIHGNITKLNLSKCHSMITDQILKLLQLRCKKLTNLNLDGCSRLSTKCLSEILPNLSFLKSLNLSRCPGCSNRLLKEFGKRGFDFHELLVESCSGVSDDGVQALFNREPQRLGSLSMRCLNLSSTSITTKILLPVLENFPRLKKLSFSNIKSTEEKVHLFQSHGLRSLDLEYLDVSLTYISDSDVKILCEICPKLTEVKINGSNERDSNFMEHLTVLSYLKSLNIAGATSALEFRHVERFLEERGHQLESLNLSGMFGVQIAVICLHCKALKDLILADCQNIDATLPAWDTLTREQRERVSSVNKRNEGFNCSDFCQHLRFLSLSHSTLRENPVEIRRQLLSRLITCHSDLRELLLNDMSDVDDEVLGKMLDSSSSGVLRKLDLSGCENITVTSVNKVLESCCNLRLLDVSYCWNIGRKDISIAREYLKRVGNPLKVLWDFQGTVRVSMP